MQYTIEFDGGVRPALQNHVNLGLTAVVMSSRIDRDVGQMNRRGQFGSVCEGTSCGSARAAHRWQGIELDDGGAVRHGRCPNLDTGEGSTLTDVEDRWQWLLAASLRRSLNSQGYP